MSLSPDDFIADLLANNDVSGQSIHSVDEEFKDVVKTQEELQMDARFTQIHRKSIKVRSIVESDRKVGERDSFVRKLPK